MRKAAKKIQFFFDPAEDFFRRSEDFEVAEAVWTIELILSVGKENLNTMGLLRRGRGWRGHSYMYSQRQRYKDDRERMYLVRGL